MISDESDPNGNFSQIQNDMKLPANKLSLCMAPSIYFESSSLPRLLSSSSPHNPAPHSSTAQMDNKRIPRHLSAASRSPLIDPAAVSSRLGLSPLRSRKSSVAEPRRQSSNGDTLLRSRWPSSSSASKNSSNSLADYLGEDSLSGFLDRKGCSDKSAPSSPAAGPQPLSRMRSCSEFSRFEEKKEEEQGRKISKENRPFGSSMRYIGKLKFPKSSSSKPDSSPSILPGRMSVDENVFANQRKATDFAVDFPSSESDRSDSTKGMSPKIPRARSRDSGPKSVDRTPVAKLATATAIRRTSSLTGNTLGMSPWALSPGRRSNSPPVPPPMAVATDGGATPLRSFSSLRPVSPEKTRKVGNIISIGLDLFRRKSGSTSNKLRPSSPVLAIGDVGHQFRMLHNCLIQWRCVNARSDSGNQTKTSAVECTLKSVWAEIVKLQASVLQKMMQLEREKLNLKLNSLLVWQMKSLEDWGDIERQHTTSLSTTQNCLQAAVCRLPLVDRAKADPQLLSIRLRQATNLTATIKSTLGAYASAAKNTVPLLSELAQVVAEEKTLLEECLVMLGEVAALQIEEESLRCHLVQLRSSQQHSNISVTEIF